MPAPTLSPPQATAILSAGVPSQPAAPGSSGVNSWVPPQKFLAGGIGGVVAWALIWGLQHWLNFDLVAFAANFGISGDALQVYIASGVAALLVYIVPTSQVDAIKVMDDETVHIAQRDPATNVSYVIKPVVPPPGEAPVITPPDPKSPPGV